MLFAMGLNNTITREMKNRGFKLDAVSGFGSEIRNEISKLTNITGKLRNFSISMNLVKPMWILNPIKVILHGSIVIGIE